MAGARVASRGFCENRPPSGSREGGRPLAGKKGTFPADALLAFARLTAALLLIAAVVLLLLLLATLAAALLLTAFAAILPATLAAALVLLTLAAAEAALLAALAALLLLTAAAALALAALGDAAGALLVLVLIVVSHVHASSLVWGCARSQTNGMRQQRPNIRARSS